MKKLWKPLVAWGLVIAVAGSNSVLVANAEEDLIEDSYVVEEQQESSAESFEEEEQTVTAMTAEDVTEEVPEQREETEGELDAAEASQNKNETGNVVISDAIVGEEGIQGEAYDGPSGKVRALEANGDSDLPSYAQTDYPFNGNARKENGETVNVGNIEVVYEDGTPVEDGVVFDLFNMTEVYSNSVKYTTKDGKLSGIQMIAGKEYKIGFDVTNEYWRKLEVTEAYKSQKLMRIYARYEGCPPLYYDYFEGIDGKEVALPKLVIKKVPEGQEAVQTRPASCIMTLFIEHDGYYADGGCPFRIVCKDNGKGKTVISSEGKLTFTAEDYLHYEIVLAENPTYVMKDKVEFTIQMDSKGCFWAIVEGGDIENENDRLCFIELERIDGKADANAGKDKIEDICGGSGDSGEGGITDGSTCLPQEYEFIYDTQKVTLSGMKVNEVANEDSDTANTTPLNKSVRFVFYNSTTQTVETTVSSKDGVLPDVQMIKGHHYIVYAEDTEYEMSNSYIILNKSGAQPTCTKCQDKEDGFYLYKREAVVEDPAVANRVHIDLPVQFKKGNDMLSVKGIKVNLISPLETIPLTSDDKGFIHADLIEDINYMVLVDDDEYSIEPFPLTIKDKSEYGLGKYPFDHRSCGQVGSIIICKAGEERSHDTTIVCPSGQTKAAGMNFGGGRYMVLGNIISKDSVKGLEGKDYEVLDVDMINLYRGEISKLAVGDFTVMRQIKQGKQVKNVYYVDGNGSLQPVSFEQKGNWVNFKMNTFSMYNNVIEYVAAAKAGVKPADPVVPQTKVSKLKAGKKKITVTLKKTKAVNGYQIQYSTNKKFKSAKSKTLKSNKTTKATIKKLKSKKKYYVRIRTYKNVKKNGKTVKQYSKWSSVKTVKVK